MKPDYIDWVTDPPEKIVNRTIIVRGVWLPLYDGTGGGEEFLALVIWSSLKSTSTGYDWFLAHGFCSLRAFNVKITHWAEMFEGLGETA
jgi:hypothetical protein